MSLSLRTEELRSGLVHTFKNGHWCCEPPLLTLFCLTRERLESHIKKWWGNKEMWLDILATEIARAIGRKVGLDREIGASWAVAVDAWLDETHAHATRGMSCPPQKAMLFSKAAILISDICNEVHDVGPLQKDVHKPFIRKIYAKSLPGQTTCTQCWKGYSRKLGTCPTCFPRTGPPLKVAPKMSEKEVDTTFWRSLPPARIQPDVLWAEVSKMMWCHGGSGGVFVLATPTGAICVKGSACSSTDLFGHCLSNALGVRTAGSRVVLPFNEENAAIRKALHAADGVEEHKAQLLKLRLSPMLTVMEFIDGLSMMGLPAHEYLKNPVANDVVWKELGRLMGFDLLINNYDRLPLAWTNEGNLGNVMLGSVQGVVVGIDHCVQPITHLAGMKSYLDRVQEAAIESFMGGAVAFGRVKAAIYNNTAIALDDLQLSSVCSGCSDFLIEVARLEASGEMARTLQMVSDEVIGAFAETNIEVVRHSTEACCQLVRDVARAVQEVMPEGKV